MSKKKELSYRTNKQIRVPQVRLVGDNIEQGVYKTSEALEIAYDMELDLVEISPNVRPPICKIIDYQKFLYDKKKKEKELQKKQKENQMDIKEIRLTPNTDDHDFDFKLNHAIRFLNNNDKVKVTIFFRGREIQFKDKGELMILKFVEALKEYGLAETLPKLEGKRLSLIIKPKK
jgi:translation initiation factor IF-3